MSLVKEWIDALKEGFKQAWEELPVNERFELIAKARQWLDDLEKEIREGNNRL